MKEVEGGLTFQPEDPGLDSVTLSEKYRRLIAAVMYAQAKGDIQNFGFVGNEAGAGAEGDRNALFRI